MKKLEFSLPSNFKEDILPVSTLDEFQKIVDKNPYYPDLEF